MAPARLSPQLRDALGSGFGAGLLGGGAAHFLAGGKMTFPIFLVLSIIMFASLKGWYRFLALVIFVIVGSLVMALLRVS